jgi:hypothetical protein
VQAGGANQRERHDHDRVADLRVQAEAAADRDWADHGRFAEVHDVAAQAPATVYNARVTAGHVSHNHAAKLDGAKANYLHNVLSHLQRLVRRLAGAHQEYVGGIDWRNKPGKQAS